MTGRDLAVLSAFSGIGGLDLGLDAAGFTTIGCIENDETARRSLKANDRWPLLDPGDIHAVAAELTPKSFDLKPRDLAVLAGGPPCQPFSKAAQWAASARVGLADARASCLLDFLRLAETFLPAVVLIENVSGFVRGPVSALSTVTEALAGINARQGTYYAAEWRVVDASAYGVPQRRSRAIVVARRDGKPFAWPSPTEGDPPTAWDAIGGLSSGKGERPELNGKWAKLLPSIPAGENYLWHTGRGGGEPLFGYRTRYWSFLLKLHPDMPAWTLPAQPGPATGPFHWDNRPLTAPEMLALQTFPSTWSVEGDYRSQVRQVGNATPPLLAEVIGRAIRSDVFGAHARGELRFAVKRRPGKAILPRRAPVPKELRHLIGEHEPHPGAGRGPKPRQVADPD